MAEPNAADRNAAANLRLPPFWSDAPRSWFTMAEAQFRLRNMVDDNNKYLSVVAALPCEAFHMVAHIVEREEQPEDSFQQLKAALVGSHMLSDYQRVEQLSKVEPLSGRRPFKLLATMLEICPREHENCPFFRFAFLQRLPREIRVLLAEEDAAELRATAEKADRFLAIHSPQAHDTLLAALPASSEAEDEAVTAAAAAARGQKKKKQLKGKKPSRSGLASPPSLGSPRAVRCTAGGFWPLRRQAGFRDTAGSSSGGGQWRQAA
jgi:hypothetical protein